MSMRNIKLTLAYDGSHFHGWQVQPDKRTIQQQLETAIGKITGSPARVAGAGRTDTGVHALGQVASFKTASRIPVERFRPALQSQLPADISIRRAEEVPLDFHAGYAARWKQYRYVILNSEIAQPHLRNQVTRIVNPLDWRAMDESARLLVGTHDFRSFESQFPNKASSVRTVHWCRVHPSDTWGIWRPGVSWVNAAPERPPFLFLDIVADGFLYNMVRAIMGTLLKIGAGSWPRSAAREVLEAMDRRVAGPTAPPEGLYLMHVEYDRPFTGLDVPAAE